MRSKFKFRFCAGSPWNPRQIFLNLSGSFYLKEKTVKLLVGPDIIGQLSVSLRWWGNILENIILLAITPATPGLFLIISKYGDILHEICYHHHHHHYHHHHYHQHHHHRYYHLPPTPTTIYTTTTPVATLAVGFLALLPSSPPLSEKTEDSRGQPTCKMESALQRGSVRCSIVQWELGSVGKNVSALDIHVKRSSNSRVQTSSAAMIFLRINISYLTDPV